MSAVTHDTEARFNALYTQYRQPIQRRIRYILKQSNLLLTEDVEQETWGKIWRALPVTEKTSFSWCSMVATNAARDALRVHCHLGYKSPPLIDSLEKENSQGVCIYESIEAAAPDLADLVSWREEIRQLLACMTDEERRVLFLLHAGYTAKELAPFALSEDEAYGAMRTLRDRMRRQRQREQARSV